MGATNKIKGTNISLQLEGKQCPQCQQVLTKQEIDDRNFDIWFDTTNDVSLLPMEELAKKTAMESLSTEYFKRLYFPFKHDGYQLTIWIRSIEHEDCPTVKECKKCYTKFLEEKMIETEDSDFYCQSCHQQINPTK